MASVDRLRAAVYDALFAGRALLLTTTAAEDLAGDVTNGIIEFIATEAALGAFADVPAQISGLYYTFTCARCKGTGQELPRERMFFPFASGRPGGRHWLAENGHGALAGWQDEP